MPFLYESLPEPSYCRFPSLKISHRFRPQPAVFQLTMWKLEREHLVERCKRRVFDEDTAEVEHQDGDTIHSPKNTISAKRGRTLLAAYGE